MYSQFRNYCAPLILLRKCVFRTFGWNSKPTKGKIVMNFRWSRVNPLRAFLTRGASHFESTDLIIEGKFKVCLDSEIGTRMIFCPSLGKISFNGQYLFSNYMKL